LSVDAAFTDLPNNMDLIIGKLSKVDITKQEAVIAGNTISMSFGESKESSDGVSLSFEVQEVESEISEVKDFNVPKPLKSVLKKFANVFAVENWSTISELPPVDINLSKEAVPVRCPLIKQSE
jgi:hypothetical protein